MDWLAPLLSWIGAHPQWAGGLLFFVAFAESLAVVGLFVPGAMLMFGAGALIATGHLDFWWAAGWAALGAIAGDAASFWLGRHLGPRLGAIWPFRANPLLLRRGVHYFRLHGGKSVLLGRFIGPIRPVVPAVAGMFEMPSGRFLLVNVVSALLWAPAYLLPGMAFAASFAIAAAVAGRLAVLAAAVLAFGWLLYLGLRQIISALALQRGRARWAVLLLALVAAVPTGMLVQRHLHARAVLADPIVVTLEEWRALPLNELLPADRAGPWGRGSFDLQWATTWPALERSLQASGWNAPARLDVRGALLWLSPEPDVRSLPPLPMWRGGYLPNSVWVRTLDGTERLVLRLWQAPLVLAGNEHRVWLATLEREQLRPAWPWIRREAQAVPAAMLNAVAAELGAREAGERWHYASVSDQRSGKSF